MASPNLSGKPERRQRVYTPRQQSCLSHDAHQPNTQYPRRHRNVTTPSTADRAKPTYYGFRVSLRRIVPELRFHGGRSVSVNNVVFEISTRRYTRRHRVSKQINNTRRSVSDNDNHGSGGGVCAAPSTNGSDNTRHTGRGRRCACLATAQPARARPGRSRCAHGPQGRHQSIIRFSIQTDGVGVLA